MKEYIATFHTHLSAMDEDLEAVYEKIGKEEYTLLMSTE